MTIRNYNNNIASHLGAYIDYFSVLLFALLILCTAFITGQYQSIHADSQLTRQSSVTSAPRHDEKGRHYTATSAPPPGVDKSWWQSASQQLSNQQLPIIWQDQTSLPSQQAAWLAPNRNSAFSSYFTEEGLIVVPSPSESNKSQHWLFAMDLSSVGTINHMLPVSKPQIQVIDNRIELRREHVTEWYINRAQGLEQGFTIHHPLNDRNETTVLELKIHGNVSIQYDDNGTVFVHDPSGNRVLTYGHLKAVDAKGKRLTANMRVNNNRLFISIASSEATYPITIDPLLMDPAVADQCTSTIIWCALGGNRISSF